MLSKFLLYSKVLPIYVLFHVLFHYGFPQGTEESSLCYKVGERESVSHSVVSDSLWPHGLKPTRLFHLWNSNQARILEWVAMPFSSGSSWPRDRTRVSCIAGRFSTIRATQEASCYLPILFIIACTYWSQTPNSSLPTSNPLTTTDLFSMSVSLFLFCRQVHLYHILYSTYKWLNNSKMVFIFVWLTSLNTIISMSIHIAANDIISSFLWLSNIPSCVCTTSSLPIHLLMDIWVISMCWLW